MEHKGTTTIETPRLTLRRFSLDDAEPMFRNWASDPDVTKYLMWQAHSGINISKSVLADWIEHYSEKEFYNWGIVLKQINQPIGSIGVVHRDDRTRMVHIGYCIGKSWWRKGIMSEALNAVIDFFLNEVGVNRVEARHDPRNPNSGRVMEKCDMKCEGTMREADFNNQGICDSVVYAVLKRDRT